MSRRAEAKPVGGGGARNPNSLANLRPGAGAGDGGLQRRLDHGGYATIAAQQLDAKTLEIYDALSADAPLRDAEGGLPRHDAAAVALLAQCLCRLDAVSAHVRDFGVLIQRGRGKGGVRPAVELEGRLRREAAGYLAELGMTPKARAALGLDIARAVGSLAGEVDAARRAREAREAKEGEAAPVDAEATVVEEGSA